MSELEQEVQKWRRLMGTEGGVSWENPLKKLKFKYDNLEWQQVETNLDMFKDLEHVKNVCGDGSSVESLNCWLDAYHQSIMNKSPITHDIYQFISHRVGIVRDSIENEISNFHIDYEMLFETTQNIFLAIWRSF
ncbi:MAG: hypothetical protein ACQET8_23205 [Bacillota bacterium]